MHLTRVLPWIHLLTCSLILVLSAYVHVRVYSTPVGDVITHIPTMAAGLYDIEQSDYLIETNAREDGKFRWTSPYVELNLWPVPATSRILTLTYMTPIGAVRISTNQQSIGELPSTSSIRTAHILTPAEASYNVILQNISDKDTTQKSRQLGFMYFDLTWRATTDIAIADLLHWWMLLRGMVFSTLLVMLLLVSIKQSLHRAALFAFGYVILMLLTSRIDPWVTIAMQATVQFVLITGISGVVLYTLLRRLVIPNKYFSLIIFCVWLLSFFVFFRPQVISDGIGYYAYVRSFFIDGNLDFANEFDPLLSPFAYTPTFPVDTNTGYTINPWSVGPAILWTPFWLIGHSLVMIFSGFNLWDADGYSKPYIVLINFASSLAGLLTMHALYQLLRRWFIPWIALATSIAAFMGTNVLYYAQLQGSYPHSFSALLATLCVLFSLDLHDNDDAPWWHWVRFGLTTGLLVLVYWMNVIICLFPALLLIQRVWKLYVLRNIPQLKRHAIGMGIALGAASLMLLPQFVIWYTMHGQLFSVYKPAQASYITVFGMQISAGLLPTENHLIKYFVGPTYGLLWWTPLYVIGLVGCWFFIRIDKMVGILSLVAICCYIVYNATNLNWHGSGAFGMRRLTTIIPFIAIGLAYCATVFQKSHHIYALFWSIFISWEIRFMLRYQQYIQERVPRNFLFDLSASVLSPDKIIDLNLLNLLLNSWFYAQLTIPSIRGTILVCCVGTIILIAFHLSKSWARD